MRYPEIIERAKKILEKDEMTKYEREEIKSYYLSLLEGENARD